MLLRWLPWTLGILIAGGCMFPVREQIDQSVCDLAERPLDIAPVTGTDHSSIQHTSQRVAPETPELELVRSDQASDLLTQKTNQKPLDPKSSDMLPPPKRMEDYLKIPPELPGANAERLVLPDSDEKRPEIREAAIDRLFPPLPPLGPLPQAQPGPEGHPMTLADLQRLAMSNSPLIRQASANVEAARGAAVQAGLYSNPIVGFETDTAGTAGSAGYVGAFIDQVIKTGGKLKIATAIAAMDVLNAQLALRRAEADLAAQVRQGYFAVLLAQKNVVITRALTQFTDEIFRLQVGQLKRGIGAGYEPYQLRVQAMYARSGLVQARNRYTAAWKGLAATLGLPAMPPTELSGSVDMPIPIYQYDKVLAHVLANHTDVGTAETNIRRARFNLALAKRNNIPDVEVRMMLQRDYTGPPFEAAPSVQVGAPVPVWNRNQGNIIQGQAEIVRATEDSHRVRNDLTARLAEAFERYDSNRNILEYYRTRMLPDQVRTYRGVYTRHQQQPESVSFGDIIVAQQTLATTVTSYVTTLGAQWTAIVDISNLLQTRDLFQICPELPELQAVPPVPDLDHLLPLACCHPCSPLQDPALKGANGAWPPAVAPAEPNKPEEKKVEEPKKPEEDKKPELDKK